MNLFLEQGIFFTKTCRSILPPLPKYKNLPFSTQTESQVDTNDYPLYIEESKSSIGESLCMVILIGNINVSSNFSIKIWIVYELKIQWTLIYIYNCCVIFLCIVRLSYINNNDLQFYFLPKMLSYVLSSSHLLILFSMNRWSFRRFLFLLYTMEYISCSTHKW